MSETLGARTVAERLRTDLLAGEFAAGSRLPPTTLAQRYETSTTVVREVLKQLAGERLIASIPNRGFFLPEATREQFRDINFLHAELQVLALTLAMERGDREWEAQIVAAQHVLRTSIQEPIDSWRALHRKFHANVVSACNTPMLLDFASQAADSISMYHSWTEHSERSDTSQLIKEDDHLVEAILARDVDAATTTLRNHILQHARWGQTERS